MTKAVKIWFIVSLLGFTTAAIAGTWPNPKGDMEGIAQAAIDYFSSLGESNGAIHMNGNIDLKGYGVYSTPDATTYANAKAIVTQGDTLLSSTSAIGLVAEGVASLSSNVTGNGLRGSGLTDQSKAAYGVYGYGNVKAGSDTAEAVGIWGVAATSHGGGDNTGCKCTASGGLANHGLSVTSGDIVIGVQSLNYGMLCSATITTSTATKQTLGTVPTGKTWRVDRILCRSASAAITNAAGTFGWNANADDVLANCSLTAMTGSTIDVWCGVRATPQIAGSAASVLGYKATALEGQADTVVCDVFGVQY